MEWEGEGWLPRTTRAQFDGAPEAAVDVDAVLALFDLVAEGGPVVVVFLPILDQQKHPKIKYG